MKGIQLRNMKDVEALSHGSQHEEDDNKEDEAAQLLQRSNSDRCDIVSFLCRNNLVPERMHMLSCQNRIVPSEKIRQSNFLNHEQAHAHGTNAWSQKALEVWLGECGR